MKKNIHFLYGTSAVILTISMSAILSFLFISGPIIAGVLLGNFSNWSPELKHKKLFFKAVSLFYGLVGLLFGQVFLFKMSGLPLVVNISCLVVSFIFASLLNKKKERVKPKFGFKVPIYKANN